MWLSSFDSQFNKILLNYNTCLKILENTLKFDGYNNWNITSYTERLDIRVSCMHVGGIGSLQTALFSIST